MIDDTLMKSLKNTTCFNQNPHQYKELKTGNKTSLKESGCCLQALIHVRDDQNFGIIFASIKLINRIELSNKIFTESINSPVGFKAVSCSSWLKYRQGGCSNRNQALMGEPISPMYIVRLIGFFILGTIKRQFTV